jgi:hypothetical protein
MFQGMKEIIISGLFLWQTRLCANNVSKKHFCSNCKFIKKDHKAQTVFAVSNKKEGNKKMLGQFFSILSK